VIRLYVFGLFDMLCKCVIYKTHKTGNC